MLEGKFLYFPSHLNESFGLTEWTIDGRLIGFASIVGKPTRIWLMCHGNGGQAAHRHIMRTCLPADESLYILEYPGYGRRPGKPSMASINAAAVEAFTSLRKQFPELPIGVIGESLGSGPASYLCSLDDTPDRLVLIVPYDKLVKVAKEHMRYLPVSLLMRDKWDNGKALAAYRKPVDIFAATRDTIIPIHHARALAGAVPHARFHEMTCGHNDWASLGLVKIE
jgi:Predicted thioesterase involved in non-ribosomal peptide biosynthesis